MPDQLFAFLVSLAIEIPVALAVCARDRRSALRVVGAGLVATGVTHPFAWHTILALGDVWPWAVAVAVVELSLTALEVLPYRLLARVTWRRAVVASVAANATSFGLGQVIWLLRG